VGHAVQGAQVIRTQLFPDISVGDAPVVVAPPRKAGA
jgi:hypothetical protein